MHRKGKGETMSINIYIGNIPEDFTPEDLKDLFKPFGAINKTHVKKDYYTKKSKGYGFVEMHDKRQGLNAIESLNDTELKGKIIVVSKAYPNPQQQTDYQWRPDS
jgi:RNA recognition motif-containing protein